MSIDENAGVKMLRDTYINGVLGPVFSVARSAEQSQLFVLSKVYPVGIPALYAYILWKNRHLLNPRIYTDDDTAPGVTRADSASGDENPAAVLCVKAKGQAKKRLSLEEMEELEEKVQARRENPELVPSMFLWKDFGETLQGYPVPPEDCWLIPFY